MRGDRTTMVVAKLLWAEMYLSAYGNNPAALPKLTDAAINLLPDKAAESPIWRQTLSRRPLQQVVYRQSYNVPFGHDRKAKWYRETLACGHEITVPAGLFEERPAQRRRCSKCADDASAREHRRG